MDKRDDIRAQRKKRKGQDNGPESKKKFKGNKKEARASGEEMFRYARWAADAAAAAAE